MASAAIRLRLKFEPEVGQFPGLDHYHGAKTQLGYAKLLRILINFILKQEIRKKATAVDGFEIRFGLSRHGSLVQDLYLYATQPEIQEALRALGQNALYDLLKWGFGGLVAGATAVITKNRQANKKIAALSRDVAELKKVLEPALKEAHSSVREQGIKSSLYLKSRKLYEFNQISLRRIEGVRPEPNTEVVEVHISKLNGRTGTGRLVFEPQGRSYSFYPATELTGEEMAILADNLNKYVNETFVKVKLKVRKFTTAAGKLAFYDLYSVSR